MLEFPRWVLTLIGISFALFHVTLGLLSWTSYDNDNLLFLSVAIYLTTVVVSLTLKPGLAMGRFMGAVSFVGALSTAITANAGIGAGQTGTYASWYVGGLGLLLRRLGQPGDRRRLKRPRPIVRREQHVLQLGRNQVDRAVVHHPALGMAHLGPRIGVEQVDERKRPIRNPRKHVKRIAHVQPDIGKPGIADMSQGLSHAVDEGLGAPERHLRVQPRLVDEMLAAAKSDFKPGCERPVWKQARNIFRCARNDKSRARPTTPMKRR